MVWLVQLCNQMHSGGWDCLKYLLALQVTIWNEKYTDDKLTRKISYIGTKLGVITEPENFCTPLWNVLPEELPPDLAEMYNPPRITIRDAEHWAEITRHLPNDLGALNRETERRLVAKLKAEIDDTGVKRRLMLEGAFGLWELSTQVRAVLSLTLFHPRECH